MLAQTDANRPETSGERRLTVGVTVDGRDSKGKHRPFAALQPWTVAGFRLRGRDGSGATQTQAGPADVDRPCERVFRLSWKFK